MANLVQFKIGSNTALPKVSTEDGTFYLARNEAQTNTTMYLSDNGKVIPVNALQSSQDDKGNVISNTYINQLDIQGNKILYKQPDKEVPAELILPNRDGVVVDTVAPENEETVLWVNPDGASDIYATIDYVNQQLAQKANMDILGDQVTFRVEGDSLIITSK